MSERPESRAAGLRAAAQVASDSSSTASSDAEKDRAAFLAVGLEIAAAVYSLAMAVENAGGPPLVRSVDVLGESTGWDAG